MKIPTVSQMVDENTLAYFPFDNNLTDYAGGGMNGLKEVVHSIFIYQILKDIVCSFLEDILIH